MGDDATTTSSDDSPTASDDPGGVVGIEPKSISRESEANTLAPPTLDGEEKANLMSIHADTDSQADPAGPRRTAESHRLNMTEIDHAYVTATKDEQQIVESWQKMNKKLKKGISQMLGSMIPWALNMTQEAKISGSCSGAMLKWVLSMNQLKSWALRMLDASGKPVAGLLEGSLTMFGNYRECLKIRAPDDDEIEFAGEFKEYFRGKYCVIQAKPWLPEKDRFYNLNSKLRSLTEQEEGEETPAWYERTVFDELSEWLLAFNFVNMRMDFCVPSLCSREDLQKVVNHLLRGIDLKVRVSRCEMDSSDGGSQSIIESNPQELPGALPSIQDAASAASRASSSSYYNRIGWLLLPLLAVGVVLIASALSLAGDPDSRSADKSNKLRHTIRSLSLKRSVGSHLNIDYDQLADDKPLAIYGIRFVLVVWVLLVESAINLKFEYLRELLLLKELIFLWPMQFIINSTLQFDSLILVTAFTMGYKNCLNDSSGNSRGLFRFVLDKYVRLMPSVMVLVAAVILLPLTYRGPVWNDYVLTQSSVCQSNGWINMAFLQNYLPYKEICLPQTWLLSVELQLVILMAPIVYFLNRHYGEHSREVPCSAKKDSSRSAPPDRSSRPFFWLRSLPGLTLVGCILLGSLVSFYSVYSNQLPPSWFYTMADPDSKAEYFGLHFMRIWTHVAVFGLGLLAGIECRRAARNVTRRPTGFKGSNLASGLALGLSSASAGNLKHQQQRGHSSSATSLPTVIASGSDINSSMISINMMHQQNNLELNSRDTISPSESGRSSGDDVNIIVSDSVSTGERQRQRPSPRSVLFNGVACLVVLGTMGSIIFCTHDWSLKELPRPLVAGLYDSIGRFSWSLAMIWILYMVSVPDKNRQFSSLSRALGHPIMVSLGKLSFLIYILHPFVHSTVLAIQEQPIYSSWLMLFHILIGNITITVILALLVSLFVEMPCRNLFRRCGTSLLLAHNHGSASAITSSSG